MSASRAGGPNDGTSGAGRMKSDEGVESNARLTAMTAAVLLVLLGAEGITLLRLHSLLWLHVLIGTALVPPVLLKMGSTFYRFVRYYRGSPAYRRKGPRPRCCASSAPLWSLRLLLFSAAGLLLCSLTPASASRCSCCTKLALYYGSRR